MLSTLVRCYWELIHCFALRTRKKATQPRKQLNGKRSMLRAPFVNRVEPTKFCDQAKTGFKSDAFEDQYFFRSIATNSSDGRVVKANIKRVGSGHACFGRNPDPTMLNLYLELRIGKAALKGIGDCRQAKSDFPERGLIAWH